MTKKLKCFPVYLGIAFIKMSELEILKSEIEALRLEIEEQQKVIKSQNRSIESKIEIIKEQKRNFEALKLENEAQNVKIVALEKKNSELQSELNEELNRCADCNCYGAEERYIHHRSGVKLCDDCETKENKRYMRWKNCDDCDY